MAYRFRLTFFHYKTGLFQFDESSLPLDIDESLEISLVARDASELKNASKFHFEGGGFQDEQSARQAGERLRTRLRVINCILGLGLTIPTIDGTSGSISDEIKQVAKKEGATIMDTIIGLAVFPDDGAHFEHVSFGKINAYPSDPSYLLKALNDIWQLEISFDEQASDALEILSLAIRELSPKASFLTTYLALERLIETKSRSDPAQSLIDIFIDQVKSSSLETEEAESLIGALGHLKEQSFSSAFSNFAKRIDNPKEICGMPMRKFVSRCISIRNKIAHNSEISDLQELNKLTKCMREMTLGIIWARNGIPDISIRVSPDKIDLENFEIKMM